MTEENPKKKSALDSIVMGAIIGTAIGSAIGMTVAPKKGSETREIIKQAVSKRRLSDKVAGGMKQLAKRLLRRLLGKKGAEGAQTAAGAAVMKELPNEMEILPPPSGLEESAKQKRGDSHNL